MTTVDEPPRAGRREWIALAVLCLPTLLTTVDISVLFLALPHLATDLHAGSTQQLWITDIYGFMIAGFLVTMGSLGDRIGHRTVLLYGAAGFVVASLLAAYSRSTVMLLGSRALLGIAAATVMPSVLALISKLFRNPKELGSAFGIWGTSIMVGVVLGPAIGGLLLGSFWWGSVFLMGVPVMLLLLVTGPRLLPDPRLDADAGPAASAGPTGGGLDLASVALSLAAILPFVYGLKELARSGWGALPLGTIVAGVTFGIGFIRRQSRLADPLLDLRLFTNRALRAALVLGLMIGFLMAGVGLVTSLYLQMVQGLSPLRVGLWLLPPSVVMIVAGNLAPVLARRVRPAYVLAGGLGLAAIGALLLTSATGLGLFVAGLIVVYIGGSPVGILGNFLVMSSAPPEKAGSAGSLSSTSGEFGVALGVALVGSVTTIVYRGRLVIPAGVGDDAAGAAKESVAGAVATAKTLPATVGSHLLAAARDAFTGATHAAFGIIAVLFAGLALISLASLRHIPPTGDPAAGPEASSPDEAPHDATPTPTPADAAAR